MSKDYLYNIGDIVNDSLRIVEKSRNSKNGKKSYIVSSIKYPEAPHYSMLEENIVKGQRDAYLSGRGIFEGNSLYSIEWIRPYLVNTDESKHIAPNSTKKIEFRCPNCNRVKEAKPNNIINQGFSCNFCSSNISYPELFMISYLEVKGINYEYQKVFKDLPNRRFDFYLPESNTVIETHGEQHYDRKSAWFSQAKIQDEEKKLWCSMNNILLVVIDCRKSNYQYIKESINNSTLPNISSIEDKGIQSYVGCLNYNNLKEIVRLYGETGSMEEVGKKLGISKTAVRNTLQRISYKKERGFEDSIVIELYKKYDSMNKVARELGISTTTVVRILENEGIKRTGTKKNTKKVLCITTNTVYKSTSEASKKTGINIGSISKACNNKIKYAGKINEKPMYWEYIN
ncbi:hypothetical protein WOJGOHIN_CDS0102 [Staphylococcus phage PG-2021_87]